jgi:hypothetical protein
MRLLPFLFIALVLSSCDYLEQKKVNSDDLLKQELQTFNWNEVDTYPTFEGCDTLTVKEDHQACFYNALLGHVNAYLEKQNLVVTEDLNDTIYINLIVARNGSLQIEHIDANPETRNQLPEIDSLLKESLRTLPKIYPAIKRGQQVTTAFELPVIVKIN